MADLPTPTPYDVIVTSHNSGVMAQTRPHYALVWYYITDIALPPAKFNEACKRLLPDALQARFRLEEAGPEPVCLRHHLQTRLKHFFAEEYGTLMGEAAGEDCVHLMDLRGKEVNNLLKLRELVITAASQAEDSGLTNACAEDAAGMTDMTVFLLLPPAGP